jgi:hypothetical protein
MVHAGFVICRKLEVCELVKYNARGCNCATLFLGEINTGTWLSRLEKAKK